MDRLAASPLLGSALCASLCANVALAALWVASPPPPLSAPPTQAEGAGEGDDDAFDCPCLAATPCPLAPRASRGPRDPADVDVLADPLHLPDGPLIDGVPAPGNDDVLDQPLQPTERRPIPVEPRRARPVLAYHPEPCLGSGCESVDPDFAARVGVDVGAGYGFGDLDGAEVPVHVTGSLGLQNGVRLAAHALAQVSSSVGPRGGVFVGPQLSFDVLDVARLEGGVAVGLAHSGGGVDGDIAPALLVPVSVAVHMEDGVDLVVGALGGSYPVAAVGARGPLFGEDRCEPEVLVPGHDGRATPGLWGAVTIGLATEFDLD